MKMIVLVMMLLLAPSVLAQPAYAGIVSGTVVGTFVTTDITPRGDRLIVTEVYIRMASGKTFTVTVDGGTLNGVTMTSSAATVIPTKNQKIRVYLQKRGSKMIPYSGAGDSIQVIP